MSVYASGVLFESPQGNATEILGLLFVSLMIIGLFTEFWLLIAGLIGLLFITPLIALLIGDQEAIEVVGKKS
ncbi:hypothetical protein D8S78_07720 [Natrialba swarupiae]|nr:hypothetical protein [Natrialba swarupiae]